MQVGWAGWLCGVAGHVRPCHRQPSRFSGPATGALLRGLAKAASAGGNPACASAKGDQRMWQIVLVLNIIFES